LQNYLCGRWYCESNLQQAARSAGKAAPVFRRRDTEVPDESPPHAFVIAEPRPLRHLDHAADFPALEQQPRGFYPQRLYPVCRCHSGAAGIGARERSRAHSCFFGKRCDLEIAGDIFDDPGVQRAEPPLDIGRLRREHGRELALAAGTFQKHNQPPRDVEGGGMAEILFDHGEREVDTSAHAGR